MNNHLVNVFIELLERESETIKFVTAQGVAKLLLLERISSPKLVSNLIISWLHPNTPPKLKHFIGVFLPLYSSKNTNAQNAFKELFLPTIGRIYSEKIFAASLRSEDKDDDLKNCVEIDGVINLMVQLIHEDHHIEMVHRILKELLKLLQISTDELKSIEELLGKHLIKCLSAFNLNKSTIHELNKLNEMAEKIHEIMEKRLKVKATALRPFYAKIQKASKKFTRKSKNDQSDSEKGEEVHTNLKMERDEPTLSQPETDDVIESNIETGLDSSDHMDITES